MGDGSGDRETWMDWRELSERKLVVSGDGLDMRMKERRLLKVILGFSCLRFHSWVKARAAVSWRTKHSREERPHVRGQEQRPRVPGCDGAGMAERSYPASAVRGGWEELPHIRGQGWRPRRATPHPRSVAAGGDTPRPRPGAAAGGSHPRPRPGPTAWRSNPRSGGCTGAGEPRGAIPC